MEQGIAMNHFVLALGTAGGGGGGLFGDRGDIISRYSVLPRNTVKDSDA
jgi:hypothetical protein